MFNLEYLKRLEQELQVATSGQAEAHHREKRGVAEHHSSKQHGG